MSVKSINNKANINEIDLGRRINFFNCLGGWLRESKGISTWQNLLVQICDILGIVFSSFLGCLILFLFYQSQSPPSRSLT